MGAELNTFDIEVSHEIDEDEIEFGSTKWRQVFIVQSLLSQIQLIRKTQKFHAKCLFDLLVFDETFCWLEVVVLNNNRSLMNIQYPRPKSIFCLIEIFKNWYLLTVYVSYGHLTTHVQSQIIELIS